MPRHTPLLVTLASLIGCAGGEPLAAPDATALDASTSEFDASSDRRVARDQPVVDVSSLDVARRDAVAVDVTARDAATVDVAARDVAAADASTAACMGLPTVPTFPGAEGFGSVARGGRCGRVIHVTTLNATGPGSLQEALDARGPRIIVFDVSGVINDQVAVTQGHVTIAGQTSPGGVIIRGIKINEEAFERGGDNDDIVIRHVRTHPDGAGLDDALRINHAQRVMIDHVSTGRAADEAIEISYSHDVTVQNTILAETVGSHAEYGGMLVNYSDPPRYPLDNLSIHHNLWIRVQGRLPELSRESDGASNTTLNLELSSNLMWAPGIGVWIKTTTETGRNLPVNYRMNWVNNLLFAGGYNGFMMKDAILDSPGSTLFFSGNVHTAVPSWTDWQLVYCCNDLPQSGPNARAPSGTRMTARLPFPAITYTPAMMLPAYMVANVGAFPRAPMDRRLLESVRTSTVDRTPYNRAGAADGLSLAYGSTPPARPADTDGDGMPDAWETANGLDPRVQDHNGVELSPRLLGRAGWTNLEVYLQQRSDEVVRDGR